MSSAVESRSFWHYCFSGARKPIEERLIAVKRNNVLIAEYAYNPQDQRVKKTVSGNTTYYLCNERIDCGIEYNSTGNLIKEYQFHPQKTWMTDPLFMRTASGDVYYYHNDHLGTPQQLVDAAEISYSKRVIVHLVKRILLLV